MKGVPRLHLISNRQICPIEQFPAVARAAALGGVDAVHIRESDLPAEELQTLVTETQEALIGTGCRVLVNFRADIAAVTFADGVHLPERSAYPEQARRVLAPDSIVGVSVHSVESAVAAERTGADYLIAGHVFETGSKPGEPGRGLDFVRDVVAAVRIPVIGIGGITPDNAGEVLSAGAYGIAVLSTILAAEDPEMIAASFVQAMDGFEVKA